MTMNKLRVLDSPWEMDEIIIDHDGDWFDGTFNHNPVIVYIKNIANLLFFFSKNIGKFTIKYTNGEEDYFWFDNGLGRKNDKPSYIRLLDGKFKECHWFEFRESREKLQNVGGISSIEVIDNQYYFKNFGNFGHSDSKPASAELISKINNSLDSRIYDLE